MLERQSDRPGLAESEDVLKKKPRWFLTLCVLEEQPSRSLQALGDASVNATAPRILGAVVGCCTLSRAAITVFIKAAVYVQNILKMGPLEAPLIEG